MLKSLAAEILGVDVDPRHGGGSLADFEWRYRVLVIFPDSPNIEATRQASILLAEADGLRERDLVVLEIGQTDVRVLFGPEEELNPHAIRYDLDVADGFFSVLLVGKDGSVKIRSDEVVPCSTIFSLIDQKSVAEKKAAN